MIRILFNFSLCWNQFIFISLPNFVFPLIASIPHVKDH